MLVDGPDTDFGTASDQIVGHWDFSGGALAPPGRPNGAELSVSGLGPLVKPPQTSILN